MATNSILPPGFENLSLPSAKTEKKSGDELSQSEFLKLMLTQVQHQDPLNPMESSEFFSQMAQIGTVNGIAKLQSSFDQFSSILQSGQALQASTMVGRSVLLEGDVISHEAGGNLKAAIELDQSTSGLLVNISDSSGQLVRQINLGSHEAGRKYFTWDGLDNNGASVAAGAYKLSAQANVDNEIISQTTLVEAKVESVTLTHSVEGPQLNVQGYGPIPMSKVKEVL